MRWLDKISWEIVLLGSMLLGLAPFLPEPHLFEKISMLLAGTLVRPIDIFDLFMHGIFPILLIMKALYTVLRTNPPPKSISQES